MIWCINTTEDYDYVEVEHLGIQEDGWLQGFDENGKAVAGWSPGFWLSYKSVEVEREEPSNQV